MDLQILSSIINTMEQSALSVLEVEFDGTRVRMEKPVAAGTRSAGSDAASFGVIGGSGTRGTASYPKQEGPIAPEAVEAAPHAEEAPQKRAGSKELKSPMVGTFHFIKGKEDLIGKKFKQGEPVCTIEAMKLMNEIVMEEDGEIAWVALSEGDMVEYGQLILTFE